jgi:phytoene/squalene synthetase
MTDLVLRKDDELVEMVISTRLDLARAHLEKGDAAAATIAFRSVLQVCVLA